jgi:2,3-bisphosphoglycerate-dependent phosphoglycerate mutase
VRRGDRFLDDLPLYLAGQRILVIGHVATRWALDHLIDGVPLKTLAAAEFAWQPGWEYLLADAPARRRPATGDVAGAAD